MILVNAQQMKEIDHYAIKVLEIPEIVLMENAALRVIDHLDTDRRDSFAIFCGTGNNGGDGLAIARGLIALNKKVDIYMVGDRDKGSTSFRTNYRALVGLHANIKWMETLGDIDDLRESVLKVNTLVDCLIGTGLDRQVTGMKEYVIEIMNRSRVRIISVDVPSGLDASTGQIQGICCEATQTICLQIVKTGVYRNKLVAGDLQVVPIGIPPKAVEAILGKNLEAAEHIN